MKHRSIVAFFVISLFLLPTIASLTPAAAQQANQPVGQPPVEIVFKSVTDQTAGIIQVAKGDADVFLWSQPLSNYKNVPKDLMNNLALIPSGSVFVDIALNPASNVYDSKKPGVVQLKDRNITGQRIPGLVYLNADKVTGSNWVGINKVAPNDHNIKFNPWGYWKIRLALEYLIDRNFIVQSIYQGSAVPMLTALLPTHGDYGFVQDIPESMGISAAADVQKAVKLFNQAIDELNKTYQQYGYKLYYKTVNGKKVLYFKYPDGYEEPVTVNFLIRIEDERLQIGRQIAKWIEDYFGIKVNRIERERSVVTPVVYGQNPIDTSKTLGNVMWSMYTEGWVSTGEEPAYWHGRGSAAFFYAPLLGYGPNHRVTSWWYFYNPWAYELGKKLFFGAYTPDQKQQLINDIRAMVKWGLEQSIRVFIAQSLQYFAVNKNRVTYSIYGAISGLWTPWALRTIRTVDGKLTILEYSSQGALFMSAWNPVLGFNDIYSNVIWNLIHDFSMYNHPVTGMPTPLRATWDVKIGNITVPEDAMVYDPVANKWITIGEAIAENKTYIPGVSDLIESGGKAKAVVVFNYKLGKWHDGSKMTLADILGSLAFDYEWAFNDTKVTGKPDPYYDPEIDSAVTPALANIFGIKIINDTAVAIYTPYVDVDPALIASQVDIWPTVPLHLLLAMEKAVVEDPGGTNYGWTTREATHERAIDMLKDGKVIKQMALELKGSKVVYLNGLNLPFNLDERVEYLAKFIDTYGHAVVSNGPYMVVSYNPSANELVLKAFKDYPLPRGYIPKQLLEVTHNNVFYNPAPLKTTTQGTTATATTATTTTTTTPTATTTTMTTTTQTTKPATTTTQTTAPPTQTTSAAATSTAAATKPGGISAGTAAAIVIIIILIVAGANLALRRK
ncbi:hypothetical protein [Pyrodictium occultum]|uniref:hypothetical protein n=1 Tax=Pyrodictium occultum TaxID=2309 RepID=UPI00071E8063|nr:hypothetical protein [Pyrodictium occultum]